jgi:malonyl-CoA O-methyltransferase
MQIKQFTKNKIKDNNIKNILNNHNYIEAAYRARKWVDRNTIQNKGIVITSKQRIIYQEVTGYYIPTLLQWGMRDKAKLYAKYLCEIQEKNGAWLNGEQKNPSVFNTGQVLRGLFAIADIYPEAYEHLIKGCDWIISNMDDKGRLTPTEGTTWVEGVNSELIHLYCLPPLLYVGEKYKRDDYINAVHKIKKYYMDNYKEDIDNFNYLSHFYAYIIEALVDLGEKETARNAMNKIQQLQKMDGAVPAFKDCNWVCSTGLFQFAIIWFKLGNWKCGNKAFDYAVSLQNKSGGWFGGYNAYIRMPNGKKIKYACDEVISYFPEQEISWAVKYFFDALYYRELVEFEHKAHTFLDYIDSSDSKYKIVFKEMLKQQENGEKLKILDVGCGKGRYLKKMYYSNTKNIYDGIDLSPKVLKYVKNPKISISTGNILNTGKNSEEYDLVFATESLEHSIFIDLAIQEMVRITKKSGKIIIIDKDEEVFNDFKYKDWIIPDELSTKQWLNTEEMKKIFEENNLDDIEIMDIPTSEGKLYKGYIGRKI